MVTRFGQRSILFSQYFFWASVYVQPINSVTHECVDKLHVHEKITYCVIEIEIEFIYKTKIIA